MKVTIPFKPRFKAPLINGTKTWTSRTKRYGNPGDTFEVFDQEFLIEKVERRTLGDVAESIKQIREALLNGEEIHLAILKEDTP